jgi:hypothetical protein
MRPKLARASISESLYCRRRWESSRNPECFDTEKLVTRSFFCECMEWCTVLVILSGWTSHNNSPWYPNL